MAQSMRVRKLAKLLEVPEDDLVLWLGEHVPGVELRHPADYVSAEAVARAQEALGKPAPAPEPVERRCAECMGAPARAAVKGPANAEPRPAVKIVAVAEGEVCAVCGNSVNRRAALALLEAFRTRGLRRLLVVGGGPGTAEELRNLLGATIEVRIIDGEQHRNATQAEAELRWADVAVVWGSTILPHKVSKLYTDQRGPLRDKLVSVHRRGVAALCGAVMEKLGGMAAAG